MSIVKIIKIGILLALVATVFEVIFIPMIKEAEGSWFNWTAGLLVTNCVALIFGFLIGGSLRYCYLWAINRKKSK